MVTEGYRFPIEDAEWYVPIPVDTNPADLPTDVPAATLEYAQLTDGSMVTPFGERVTPLPDTADIEGNAL